MTIVTRNTDSGLVLAEHAQDEAAIGRALRRLDDRLVLQKHASEATGGWVYKVLRVVSDDSPAIAVATWADERGRPLPLTFGIVELVDRLRRDGRNKGPDADEQNERHLENVAKLRDEFTDLVLGDHRAKVDRGRVSVSVGNRTSQRQWQRNHHLPEWLRRL